MLVVIAWSSNRAVSAVQRHGERNGRVGVTSAVVERDLFLADDELARRLEQPQSVQLRVRELADRRRRKSHVNHLQDVRNDHTQTER